MPEEPLIRNMVSSDVEQVFALIDKENWGWELHEIQRIYALDTQNSIVAEYEGAIVGLITLINYGRTAFIVHVIVKDGWRKKRLGAAMMREIMQKLDAMDVDHVELHAMPDAIDFYNQFGFSRIEPVLFLCRVPSESASDDMSGSTNDPEIRLLERDEMFMLADCQAKLLGCDERDLRYGLEADAPQYPVGRMVGGSMTSLLLARKGTDINQLGPWFMNHPDVNTARSMIRYATKSISDRRIDVGIPSSNLIAREALLEEGFTIMNEGIMRVARSARTVVPFPRELMAFGHLGLI